MKALFFYIVFLTITIPTTYGQIWGNPITGTNPNTSNPYTAGQTVHSDITVSGIGRGAGITGTNANNRYNANSWNTGSIDLTAYFEFTLTPNSGCQINFVSFVYTGQTSGTGPTSFAFRSSVDGYVNNIGSPSATGTTINLSGTDYQNITSSVTFRLYGWGASGSGGTFSVNDFTFNGTVICGSSNTITTGVVSGDPFSVDCSSADAGTVAFTSDGTFNSGNTYTAQLSDASGSFSSPIDIGTFTSTANSGSINITIPSGTPTGSGYRIRIVSNNPFATGSESSPFTVNLTGGPCVLIPPHVTSLIFDGCNTGSCNEGESEIVFATTGDYSVLVNSSNIDLEYTVGAAYDLLGTVVDVPSTTTTINTDAGCGSLYLNGFGQTIPPNSTILFLPSQVCVSVFDWAALCGQGPIYIVYGQSGSSGNTWRTTGNFGNSGTDRTFELSVTATNGTTHTSSYSYNGTGGNGAYAVYGSNPPGGSPASQGVFPNCTFTPVVLSTDVINFHGIFQNHQTNLFWKTLSEQNNSHFTIFRSQDGYNWENIGRITGAGTPNEAIEYDFTDYTPKNGVNYYRLHSTDFDGTTYHKGIVVIETGQQQVYFNTLTSTIELLQSESVEIYSLEGKLIKASSGINSIPFNHSGMFLIHFTETGKTERIITNVK